MYSAPVRNKVFPFPNWVILSEQGTCITQKGRQGWGQAITKSYLGGTGGTIGGIHKGLWEKRGPSIFPWTLDAPLASVLKYGFTHFPAALESSVDHPPMGS